MKYIKTYENLNKFEPIVLLPSGEIIEVGNQTVDKLFYDNDTYDFPDYDIEWDYSIAMYQSKDKYKGEILKRNEMYINRSNEYKNKFLNKKFESFDFNEDDFEWDEENDEWIKADNNLKVGDRVMMDRDNDEYSNEGKDKEHNDILGTIKNIRRTGLPYWVLWDGMSDRTTNHYGYSNRHLLYNPSLNEKFDFDDEDFEWDEDDINKNFEYVKTSNFMHNSNIYISLKEIKNDGEVGEQLKLFKDKWTNGWNIKSFIPLTNNEMDIIKNKNMKIGFFDGYKWKSLSYNKFIKKYPQFEI